jgi:DNA-binding transcriptional LysR family regulator
MFELDLHRLAVFYTVVNEGTLSKAGDSLYMSQPAISAHIKALEQQLGMPLFYRVGRRSVVNKAGEVLYKKAEQLFSVADELKAEMEELKGMYIGRLNLGASVDWQYMLPNALDRFKQKYTGVEVSMGIASEDRIERMVLDRSLDFGFVGQASSRTEMVSELLARDELVPVCSKSHRLARKSRISASDLDGESFVIREVESAARSLTDERLEDLGLIGSITMELGSYEAIKSAVMSGKGIGIVTRQSLDAELKAGLLAVLDVPQLTAVLELHLIYLRQKKMTSTQNAFLEMACAHGAMAGHLEAEGLIQVPKAS